MVMLLVSQVEIIPPMSALLPQSFECADDSTYQPLNQLVKCTYSRTARGASRQSDSGVSIVRVGQQVSSVLHDCITGVADIIKKLSILKL